MLTIKFKDVGQGDSIILHWQQDNISKIGIIDCNKYCGGNPILDEIKDIEKPFEIEFLILSHGHYDHYSGFYKLLEYCEKKEIKINNFITTVHPSQVQFLNTTLDLGTGKMLKKLITKVKKLNDLEKIEELYFASNRINDFLIDSFTFKCLYPRPSDHARVGRQLTQFLDKKIKALPNPNEVATIFKISCENFYCLLTSDCTTEGLEYIFRKDKDVQENQLQLAQAPHHGSKNNHNKLFWLNRNRKENCPIVFSSGISKHNLPNKEVVDDFYEMEYKIYSTNFVNGIIEVIENKDVEPQKDYSYLLDNFTQIVSEFSLKNNDRFVGDKVFQITKKGVEYIPLNR